MNRVVRFGIFSALSSFLVTMTFAVVCGAQAGPAGEEAKLIEVLRSNTDWQVRQDACRRLRRIGTARSIPALAPLLGDEKLSHMARYALEPMPYPEVNPVLRAALATAPGLAKAGIATTLGVRRDTEAVPALAALLNNKHDSIANAAAGALGRIGTVEAVKALFSAKRGKPGRAMALDEAALAAGERLMAGGQADPAQRVFNVLLNDTTRPQQVRMGAFRGLAQAAPAERPGQLLAALAGNDPVFRDFAAQLVAETPKDGNTLRYASQVSTLPAEGRVVLLRALATRGDAVARPAVLEATKDPDIRVRASALAALERLGTAKDVALLARVAGSDDPAAEAAHATLVGMEAEGVDDAMARIMGSGDAALRPMLIDLLVVRGSHAALPAVVARLDDKDLSVRLAALQAVSALGGEEQAPVLLARMKDAPEAVERKAAAKAFNALCAHHGETMLPVILGAMEDADATTLTVMMGALQRVGGPRALNTVLKEISAQDKTVQRAAMETLLSWPTPDAAPHLLPFMEGTDPQWHDAALRAYVRLAKNAASGKDKIAMLEKATSLCTSRENTWVVLAAWGTAPSPKALKVLRPFLDDPEVRNEAASAIIGVCRVMLRWRKAARGLAREALREVMAKCDDQAIRDRAQRTLEQRR